LFLEIIGGLASVASISGITAKELIPFISDPDKKLFEKYFSYLEGKKVLIAPFDSEVSHAVIKSLESIKEKTEQLRLDIKSKQAQHLLLDLIHTLSQNLMLLYKHQNSIDEVLFINLCKKYELNLQEYYLYYVLRMRSIYQINKLI
jgi:bifunctional ADP-heptose synthase (sugar kinase/adenylyltransferase)